MKIRIGNYLNVDKLRPELLAAVTGLQSCRIALNEHANRFMQLPQDKRKRQKAVEKLTALIEKLEEYLKNLDTSFFYSRKAGTGIGVFPLNQILDNCDQQAMTPPRNA